jgi:uncharacterized protein YpuA (DUF1002 family)
MMRCSSPRLRTDKPVSGETALVAIFKAYPTCSGGRQADPQRVRLAYQQVKVTIDIAGRSSDLTHASAVFLEVLQAVITGQAADVSGVEKAVDSAATREGLTLDNSTRAEAINLLEQLRHVDYGPYARGFVVQQLGGDRVRVMTAQ